MGSCLNSTMMDWYVPVAAPYTALPELLAGCFCNAISVEVLRTPENKGFLEFADKSHLPTQLAWHQEHLQLLADGRIAIQFEGEYRPWNEVKTRLTDESGEPIGCYTAEQGWDLTPMDAGNHPGYSQRGDGSAWQHMNLLVYATWTNPIKADPDSNHSWLELWRSDGRVVNLHSHYHPFRHSLSASRGLETVEAQLYRQEPRRMGLSGDKRPKGDRCVHEITWEVSKAEAVELETMAQNALSTQSERVYNVFLANCMDVLEPFTKSTGVILPSKFPVTRILKEAITPESVMKLNRRVEQSFFGPWLHPCRILPKSARRWINTPSDVMTGIALNCLAFTALGAKRTTQEAEQRGGAPIFERFQEVFDYKRLLTLSHPHRISVDIQPSIDRWRSARARRFRSWMQVGKRSMETLEITHAAKIALRSLEADLIRHNEISRPDRRWRSWYLASEPESLERCYECRDMTTNIWLKRTRSKIQRTFRCNEARQALYAKVDILQRELP
jgi:hypothetical protein